MSDYASRADVRAMPENSDHLDAAVFAAVRAIAAAEAAHNRAMELAAEDLSDVEQEAFHAAFSAALDTLAACTPRTSAGARAMLKGILALDPMERPDEVLEKVAGFLALADAA